MFIDFREGKEGREGGKKEEREREREQARERNIHLREKHWLPSVCTRMRHQNCNLSMCPPGTYNMQHATFWCKG